VKAGAFPDMSSRSLTGTYRISVLRSFALATKMGYQECFLGPTSLRNAKRIAIHLPQFAQKEITGNEVARGMRSKRISEFNCSSNLLVTRKAGRRRGHSG